MNLLPTRLLTQLPARRWLILCLWIAVFGLASCKPRVDNASPVSPPDIVSFVGVIERNTIFEHPISSTLHFRLLPYAQDWAIWVGDPAERTDNFTDFVTPPRYGINDRYIEGWHFRNQDNSGANAPGEENVNAPQKVRHFCLVLNGDDYQSAVAWQQIRLASGPSDATTFDFGTATGILTITELDLGNLIPHQRAWIERMAFAVAIDFATPCTPF